MGFFIRYIYVVSSYIFFSKSVFRSRGLLKLLSRRTHLLAAKKRGVHLYRVRSSCRFLYERTEDGYWVGDHWWGPLLGLLSLGVTLQREMTPLL